MEAFIKPLVYGIAAACIAIMGLWLAIPLLLSAFTENWVAWYPFLIIVPPLILGGYVSAQKVESKHVHRYLAMGGAVGIAVMAIAMAVTTTKGQVWFTVAIAFGGSAISVFGAYLGSLRRAA